MLRAFVEFNTAISRWLERRLPADMRVDGNKAFQSTFVAGYLKNDQTIYDLGGGSNPFLDAEAKKKIGAYVKGLDIAASELAAAPAGSYDEIEVADLTTYGGDGKADLVISQCVLEHVKDNKRGLKAIASALRPGGKALIFLPCRNAWFARINLIVPERLKQKVLFAIYPSTADGHSGFPAYYDCATPAEMTKAAEAAGLVVERVEIYWKSSYFQAFFPLHFVWRGQQWLARKFIGAQACESFAFAMKKPSFPGTAMGGEAIGQLAENGIQMRDNAPQQRA